MGQKITVIKGDGIGPSIVDATLKILDKLDCNFEYEFADAGLMALEKTGELLPEETIQSIEKNKIVLKGPLETPIGKGFRSLNVALRQKFQLYANLRPVKTLPGTKSRYDGIDIVTVRENTEGMYSGEGQVLLDNNQRAEAKSVVTREGARRVFQFACETAKKLGRKKLTIVHKANILKTTSGLFREVAYEVAKKFPELETNEMIVDNCCMQLVMNPHQFDMIVTTNLFGDILSDLCAGLVGGLGMAPGANIGHEVAIFEAVHGTAPDIAGKNLANPTSLILAAALMLDHLGENQKAQKLRDTITTVLKSDKRTKDLGGTSGTTEFTQAILDLL